MIVSNATPLIAFARIGQLGLLQEIVKSIVIPKAVALEISTYDQDKTGLIDLLREQWISVREIASQQQVSLLLPTLDRGESEVIVLALEQKASLVLIDELAARQVCKSLNIPITGSIGILIKAQQLGKIAAVKPYIETMQQQGIYYSQKFIDLVLQTLAEG